MEFRNAQKDMRIAYFGGGTGVIVSGLVWLAAGLVAWKGSAMTSMLVLFIGGMFIFPLGVLLDKLLKRSGRHQKENPLGGLAIETTFLIFIGLFIAYTMFHSLGDWFFSIMLMIIGGRYLMFKTMYGMKAYWVLGGLMIVVGLASMILTWDFHIPAILGGLLELIFAFIIMSRQVKMDQ